jgi:hypothetical protein
MNIMPQLKSLSLRDTDAFAHRVTSRYGVTIRMWRQNGGWGAESP